MGDRCHTYRDLLVASTLQDLADAKLGALREHLERCPDCKALQRQLREDDVRLDDFVTATVGRLEDLPAEVMAAIGSGSKIDRRSTQWRKPRLQPRRSTTWFGIAAAVIVFILFGLAFLDRGAGPGVVWAEVITRVESANSFICERIEKLRGEPEQRIVEYRSAEHGLRQDIYQGGRLQAVQYVLPQERIMYAIIHRDRTYMRQRLSPEQVAELERQSNAQEIVKSFRSHDFHELGRRRIDGKHAEGIEIVDPQEWGSIFEGGRWRLWVDVDTQWPVRIELEGSAKGGTVKKTYTLRDFEWNAPLSAEDFAAEIPEGYKLIADLGGLTAATMAYCLVADLVVLPAQLALFGGLGARQASGPEVSTWQRGSESS